MQNHFLHKKIIGSMAPVLLMVTALSLDANVVNVPADYTDIQTAINAVSTGGTVNIAAGTYPLTAQLYINKNITLAGAGIDATIIQSPDSVDLTQTFSYTGVSARLFTPVIIVENASAVFVQNLTVDGRNQSVFGAIQHFSGIGYHDASGTISNTHVLNIQELNEPRGYQEGSAIVAATDTGTNEVTVQDCVADYFQKQGVLCLGAGLTATINGNTITAINTEAGPNGIEFFDGSTGVISNNTLSNFLDTNEDCSGILIFNAAGLTVENNAIHNSDNGIYIDNCNNTIINNNTLSNNFFSITLDDSGATVANISHLSGNDISNDTSLDPDQTIAVSLYSPPGLLINPQSFFDSNTFSNDSTYNYGLIVNGNSTDTAGPIVSMHNDTFIGSQSKYYIQMVSCPNDIWPTTATVSFNGLISGQMTPAQFATLVTDPVTQQIYDKNTDPTLGLVLSYITQALPTVMGLSPNMGSFEGGTVVTITGTNFIRGAVVNFGSQLATNVIVESSTTILATSPAGVGTVPVTVTTGNGTSVAVPADNFTYIGTPTPLPPTNFTGVIKENIFLNRKVYRLFSTWDPSLSSDVVAYRIYKNGTLIDQIAADSCLILIACLCSSNPPLNYQVTALSSTGLESTPVILRIVYA